MKKIVYLEPYFPKGQFILGIFAILSLICFSSLYLIDLGTKTQDVRLANAQVRAQELAGFTEVDAVYVGVCRLSGSEKGDRKSVV